MTFNVAFAFILMLIGIYISSTGLFVASIVLLIMGLLSIINLKRR